MKLLAIRLENVRRFIDPVEVTGIGSGLNVLTAPNESGKSTVFDALHALFFKGYRSWDKEVAGLAPHVGGDPEVAVDLEVGDSRFRVEKRWSKTRRGEAKVFRNGHLIKQADDAEVWLADALKAPKDGGPAGLLWVRQGTAGLDEGDAARTARRDLLSSVAGEVEAMTGGRRMDAAQDRCRQELERFVTSKGKAKTGGPLKLAEDEVSALENRRGDLLARVASLHGELDRRRDLARELADLEDAEQDSARETRLATAQAAFDEAARHVQALDKALEVDKSRRLEMERAQGRLDSIQAALAEEKAADTAFQLAKVDAAQKEERCREAEALLADHKSNYDEAKASAESADEVLRNVLRRQASERRSDFMARLAQAESFRKALENAAAEAKLGPADKVANQLEALFNDVRVARKTRESEAAALTMRYAAGRMDGVVYNRQPLPDGMRVGIPDGATLEIEGIGRLTIHPGARSSSDTVLAAEKALAGALKSAGYGTTEAMRAARQRKVEAEARRRDVESQLRAIAPDGIDAIRQAIVGLPEAVDFDGEIPSVTEAQAAEQTARRRLLDMDAQLDKARAVVGAAQTAFTRAAAAIENAEERLSNARNKLSAFGDPEDVEPRLAADLVDKRTALLEAIQQREALSDSAPDLEATRAALDRARSVIASVEERSQRIRIEVGKLDTAIEMHAAEAVEEELADVENRLSAARRRLDEITFEVSVLQTLAEALESARATARDSYVEPVLHELKPLIRLFWPQAELRFDTEDVLPTALVRAGTEEDFDVLSGGTQEQIALLVRLAFARMLAKSGRLAPVILDDAIVYTDDERIERMFDALTRQAQDLQIIVFSCRQKAFRDLGGRSLAIARQESALDAA